MTVDLDLEILARRIPDIRRTQPGNRGGLTGVKRCLRKQDTAILDQGDRHDERRVRDEGDIGTRGDNRRGGESGRRVAGVRDGSGFEFVAG